jgi:hypothetical protein
LIDRDFNIIQTDSNSKTLEFKFDEFCHQLLNLVSRSEIMNLVDWKLKKKEIVDLLSSFSPHYTENIKYESELLISIQKTISKAEKELPKQLKLYCTIVIPKGFYFQTVLNSRLIFARKKDQIWQEYELETEIESLNEKIMYFREIRDINNFYDCFEFYCQK